MPKITAKALTPANVEKLRYRAGGPRIQRIWDAAVPGLGVEVFASGRKSWVLRYDVAGTRRLIKLGPVAEMDLDAAQRTAIKAKGQAADGDDPKALRDAPDDALTVRALWEKYQGTAHYRTRSADFRAGMESTMRVYVLPAWGSLPLTAVKRSQIRDTIDALIEDGREGAARGLLNRARILFNYALERDLLEASPADHIKPRFTTTGRRTTWLATSDELRAAWWIDAPIQVRLAVRWMLLTGCRRDEARTATRDQISTDAWRVADTKNDLPLVIPMMPAMVEIAQESRVTFGGTAWLFPATVDNHKAIPRGTWDWALRQATEGRWSAHVLRHTVESHMRELEIPEESRDAVLNHVRQSTGSRYGHGEQLALKTRALEQWHRHLQHVVHPSA
jgi:integrase